MNLALKKNLELRLRLEQMEEEQELGVQNAIIEAGERWSQKIKEAGGTGQIEEVIREAYEQLDGIKGGSG